MLSTADVPNAPTLSYVGFWMRTISKVIDVLFLGALNFAIHLVVTHSLLFLPRENETGPQLLLAMAYYYFSWRYFSATIGNYLLKQSVVSVTLGKPTPLALMRRAFAAVLSECLLGLPYLFVAFDSRKQGLHDKLAQTLVVQR
jgi:uncharacterized RDD family membrane protein YckC